MNTARSATTPPRRLALVDLIIAVAAVSLWMAVTRAYLERSVRFNPSFMKANRPSIWEMWCQMWWVKSYHDFIIMFRFQLGWLLMILSVTMLVIRLRGPRPPRRRLWRQPGLAASAGAALGSLVGFVGALAKWSAAPGLLFWDAPACFIDARSFAAPGVVGAWLTLALTGRWRSERSAIDRLGRLVGLLWLLEFAVSEMPGWNYVAILDNLIRRGFH